MAELPLPYDLAAEQEALGDAMLLPQRADFIFAALRSADFYSPKNREVFEALLHLRSEGADLGPRAVIAALRQRGSLGQLVTEADVVEIGNSAAGSFRTSVEVITGYAVRRRMLALSDQIRNAALDDTTTPAELLDDTRATLETITLPVGRPPSNLTTLDAFLDRPVTVDRDEWVVPGMLRRKWRAIVVAPEGVGKTVFVRQMVMAPAQGYHPFLHEPIARPVRSLLVDLENPEDHVDEVCNPIRVRNQRVAGEEYDPDRIWLWHKPEGIDIRTRKGFGDLEAAIAYVRPELVGLGPLYKLFRRKSTEDLEEVANDVSGRLDELRERYGFALVMEHHVPKGQHNIRDLVPFGSAVWMRWPEFGKTLAPTEDPNIVELGNYRPDRLNLNVQWPLSLSRNPHGPAQDYPWVGTFPTGTFNNGRAAA